MIPYADDGYGLKNLFIWHGSAVFRAFLPATFSTGILLIYQNFLSHLFYDRETIVHPYVIGVFVSILAFLLVFRLNYSYQRYWEAATQVHQMSSKWLDSAMCLASFHYQCHQYDDIKPLTFGANPKVRNETRDREREQSTNTIPRDTTAIIEEKEDGTKKGWIPFLKKKKQDPTDANRDSMKTFQPHRTTRRERRKTFSISLIRMLQLKHRKPDEGSSNQWRASFAAGRHPGHRIVKLTGLETTTPSLFLQEAAHLFSLLSAVAMSTLRCDVEGAESPLAPYIPGIPFPPVNPDELTPDIQLQYYAKSPLWSFFYYLLGIKQSQQRRTLYNAARPFRVIGGISDGEASCLQEANGPNAEMALCTMWLKEFVTREYLNGSTGKVAPPIISRVYQYISDGVVAYTQCRKVAYVPFPFPQDQATVLYTFISLFVFPMLFAGYVTNRVVACVLNFITTVCFVGTHEVARELSDPYYTFPNDLPLNNFQTQFNEALVCMWAGFHPDSYRADEDSDSESSSVRRRKLSAASRNEVPLTDHFDSKGEEKTFES